MEQTKLVKLINMPFFVVADLSAEDSTDHISRTYLLKVSQNAGKSVYTVYTYYLAAASGGHFPWRPLVYLGGLSCGSSGFF